MTRREALSKPRAGAGAMKSLSDRKERGRPSCVFLVLLLLKGPMVGGAESIALVSMSSHSCLVRGMCGREGLGREMLDGIG